MGEIPSGLAEHLRDRVRERKITILDLQRLQLWIAANPDVPAGDWFKDFGTFKICGTGAFSKTFLSADQILSKESLRSDCVPPGTSGAALQSQ